MSALLALCLLTIKKAAKDKTIITTVIITMTVISIGEDLFDVLVTVRLSGSEVAKEKRGIIRNICLYIIVVEIIVAC